MVHITFLSIQLICHFQSIRSHTCQEGGAHLRISFWHLLMNFKKPKKSEFWKNKKKKTFYTCVPETTMYKVQFLRYRVRQISCHYESFFALSPPPLTTQKTKILKKKKLKKKKKKKKKKKCLEISSHRCTKAHDHTLYCSWDMVCDGCNCFFSLWAIFCLFTP